MEKKLLPYLVVISAISVSLSAAYYSVTGIGHMFSGQKENVMIMMGTLEVSKLVLASIIYQYWDKISTMLKTYYIIAVFILMMITSGGIYGYLAGAYSETDNKINKQNIELSFIDKKIENFEKNIDYIDNNEISFIQNDLNSDRKNKEKLFEQKSAKRQYRDPNSGEIIETTISYSERTSIDRQLKELDNRISINESRLENPISRISNLKDSIQYYQMKKFDIESSSDISAEMGPLNYISDITGKPVNQVVNWFIIALMLVFDPLAVSLVIGANIIFSKKEEELSEENFDTPKSSQEESGDELVNNSVVTEEKTKELDNLNLELEKTKKTIDELKSVEKEKVESIFNLNQDLINLKKKVSDLKSEVQVKKEPEVKKPLTKKQMMSKR